MQLQICVTISLLSGPVPPCLLVPLLCTIPSTSRTIETVVVEANKTKQLRKSRPDIYYHQELHGNRTGPTKRKFLTTFTAESCVPIGKNVCYQEWKRSCLQKIQGLAWSRREYTVRSFKKKYSTKKNQGTEFAEETCLQADKQISKVLL